MCTSTSTPPTERPQISLVMVIMVQKSMALIINGQENPSTLSENVWHGLVSVKRVFVGIYYYYYSQEIININELISVMLSFSHILMHIIPFHNACFSVSTRIKHFHVCFCLYKSLFVPHLRCRIKSMEFRINSDWPQISISVTTCWVAPSHS